MFAQTAADALYVHIPFCPHKCFYCDFNSYVADEEDLVWRYLRALERELAWTVERYGSPVLRTIFVGGGTPTMLDAAQMQFFLDSLQTHFGKREVDLELTMEANPGTVDDAKLAVMRAAGVNRISFGAQTFNEQLLKDIGRIHGPDDVGRSIQLARKHGFSNLSVDLMFGLPGQSLAMLQESLETLLTFDLPHISVYGLKIEENTKFHAMYMRNELLLPDEESELAMYVLIMDTLRAHGYEQYEISNFAKPGFASRHNLTYWRNRAYFGVGAGAHGYLKGRRHMNIKGVREYIAACEQGLPLLETVDVTPTEAMEDFMMVGLRLMEGVSRQAFAKQFGIDWEERFGDIFARLTERGLLQPTSAGYRLSRQGIPLGNEVFAHFLS